VAPGGIVLNATFGATSAAWMSSECGMSTSIAAPAPLTNVTSTTSPCSTTIGGDTPVPRMKRPLTPNDQTRNGGWSAATFVRCVSASTRKRLTRPAGIAGSVGSGRRYGS
jgi:hypothetical protein